jgi:hypothetical protein
MDTVGTARPVALQVLIDSTSSAPDDCLIVREPRLARLVFQDLNIDEALIAVKRPNAVRISEAG